MIVALHASLAADECSFCSAELLFNSAALGGNTR